MKAENIREKRLSYIRKKTKKKIELSIAELAMKIIDKYNCSATTGYIAKVVVKKNAIKNGTKDITMTSDEELQELVEA